jgi:5'-deoxynucleotidase YfbR-like HD superfamily hydrolase
MRTFSSTSEDSGMPKRNSRLSVKVALIVTALVAVVLTVSAAAVALIAHDVTVEITTRDAHAVVKARAAELGRMAEKVFLQLDFMAEEEELGREDTEAEAYVRSFKGRLPPEIRYVFLARKDGAFITSDGAKGTSQTASISRKSFMTARNA